MIGKLNCLIFSLCFLVFQLFSFLTVFAQSGSTSGVIVGVVKDSTAAVIVGATLTVRQIDTNITRTIQTDNNGNYSFNQLPPGRYEITAAAENFGTQNEIVDLTLGTTALADFSLYAQGTIVDVTVNANNDLAPKTENSTNIDRAGIDNLPSNQRNFLDLSFISPRVTMDRLPQRGIVVTSGISINGQSARFNNITIDGLDNNDHITGSVRSTFSQDGVQEFQVVSDSYSAEFGRVLGGVINIVTRGGGNQLHGDLFVEHRTDKLNARDVFALTKGELRKYQFGANLSGPIKRDRLFFFSSFERLTDKESNISTIKPSVINAARNQGFILSSGNVPYAIGTTSLLARVDGQLTPNDTFWLRYNGGFSYNGNYEPFRGNTDVTAGGIQQLEDNSFAVNNTYINSNLNFINETRLLFGSRSLKILANSEGPFVQINDDRDQITFGRNPLLPQTREEKIYQIIDNLTLPRGRHQLKLGIDLAYTNLSKLNVPNFASGAAIFTPIDFSSLLMIPAPRFSALEALDPSLRSDAQRSFLTNLAIVLNQISPNLFPKQFPLANLALPMGYSQSFGNSNAASNYTFFTFFVQDEIKLGQNLLVKAGLRYDLNRVRFAPNTAGNLSPRFAFSYRPKQLPNLNIRGAYGIFVGAPLAGVILNAQISSTALQTIALPFPLSTLLFSLPGHHAPESLTLPNGAIATPQTAQTITVASDLKNSYTQQVSVGIDYTIKNNTQISLSYDYVRGLKLFGSRNINPISGGFNLGGRTAIFPLRNDPTQGDVIELESAFDSYYNAFTVAVNRRFRGGFGLLAHYTLSKTIDNSADFFPLFQEDANPLRPGDERALSIQDVRSRFVASGSWTSEHQRNLLLRDFQVSMILSLNSGRPYNLLAGVDLDMNGDRPPADRPLGISRNAGITPGFASLDLRLSRKVRINEQISLQAFIEAFNLFNRVNINPNEIDRIFPPDAANNFPLPPIKDGHFITRPDQYQDAFAPRQLQFGLRLSF